MLPFSGAVSNKNSKEFSSKSEPDIVITIFWSSSVIAVIPDVATGGSFTGTTVTEKLFESLKDPSLIVAVNTSVPLKSCVEVIINPFSLKTGKILVPPEIEYINSSPSMSIAVNAILVDSSSLNSTDGESSIKLGASLTGLIDTSIEAELKNSPSLTLKVNVSFP